jgi:cell division protein FtsW (lipid II flippase)
MYLRRVCLSILVSKNTVMAKFSLFRTLRSYDWLLIAIVFILSLVGLAAIYSVDLSRGEGLSFFPTQVIAFGVGMVALLVVASLHMTAYQTYAWWIYIGTFILLFGVLIFGVTIRGTTGWFRFLGYSFQPAELAKVALVLILGWLVARHGRRFDSLSLPVGW